MLFRSLKSLAIAFAVSLLFGSFAKASDTSPIIVLVPGFFNSLIPSTNTPSDGVTFLKEPYFAKAIVETIHARGLQVTIVNNLLPVATIDGNGERLKKYLVDLSERYQGRKMILLTHSAGGLFAMRALTDRPDLPVQTVVSMATPFEGVEFVDHLSEDVPGIDALAQFLHLASLREFETKKMSALLAQYRIPSHVRWISIAGYQPPCRYVVDCSQASKLSWLLSVTQALMTQKSDGVVTVSSALGQSAAILRDDGRRLQIEAWNDFVIPLEHWEMVQESFLFRALGVLDVSSIKSLQRATFNKILDRLGPETNFLNSSVNPATP